MKSAPWEALCGLGLSIGVLSAIVLSRSVHEVRRRSRANPVNDGGPILQKISEKFVLMLDWTSGHSDWLQLACCRFAGRIRAVHIYDKWDLPLIIQRIRRHLSLVTGKDQFAAVGGEADVVGTVAQQVELANLPPRGGVP